MPTSPADHEVVLLGLGHTNAQVLRWWDKKPPAGARLTCVSNFASATYSGMLPGVLAGQYPPRRMEIDLARLCAAAGARFVHGDANGLDVNRRRLLLADHPPLPFDALSIGIGSAPTFDGVEKTDEMVVPIKPMQTFIPRLDARLRAANERRADAPLRVAVVGGGVAGLEIAFCLPRRIKHLLGDRNHFELLLVHAGGELAPGALRATAKLARRELEARGVALHLGQRVRRASDGVMKLAGGDRLAADVVVWATGAAAPPLLSKLNLPTDERGFLLTDATLRSTSGAPIFAVGDSGAIVGADVPKAGVYAVRQAPILWENIQRLLAGRRLLAYRPQRNFLKLLNTGDSRAIGEYRGVALHNRWMWKLKDFIDGRFMDKFQ